MKRRPTGPARKPPADSRPHPLPGMLYRVRDKEWVAVWAENLSWPVANRLKDHVLVHSGSRSARVEAMDIPPADDVAHVAEHARRVGAQWLGEALNRGELPWFEQGGNYVATFDGSAGDVGVDGGGGPVTDGPPTFVGRTAEIVGVIPFQPPAQPDRGLGVIHANTLAKVGKVASEAQKRSNEALAAKQRREQYKKQAEQARKELEEMEKEAEKLDAELDGTNIPESDIDDFLGGVGGGPTDDELKKAAEANRKAREAKSNG